MASSIWIGCRSSPLLPKTIRCSWLLLLLVLTSCKPGTTGQTPCPEACLHGIGMTDSLSLSTFQPLVGHEFQFQVNHSYRITLELVEATALQARGDDSEREPFSLVFSTAKASGLWQGTIRLDNDTIGSTELFLVPIGEDERGMLLQALFN